MRILLQDWVNEAQDIWQVPFPSTWGVCKVQNLEYALQQPMVVLHWDSPVRSAYKVFFVLRPSLHLCWKPWIGASYVTLMTHKQNMSRIIRPLWCYCDFCLYLSMFIFCLKDECFVLFCKCYRGFETLFVTYFAAKSLISITISHTLLLNCRYDILLLRLGTCSLANTRAMLFWLLGVFAKLKIFLYAVL